MAKALVAARELPRGHRLTLGDIAMKSPADGLEPYRLAELLGRELQRAMAPDDFFTADDLVDAPALTSAAR
jgi:sialic acid synthase SpsE